MWVRGKQFTLLEMHRLAAASVPVLRGWRAPGYAKHTGVLPPPTAELAGGGARPSLCRQKQVGLAGSGLGAYRGGHA